MGLLELLGRMQAQTTIATFYHPCNDYSRLFCRMQAISRMRRYLQEQLLVDLSRKAVVLTGARQVGKTTLARQLMEGRNSPQYLNWDVAADRSAGV